MGTIVGGAVMVPDHKVVVLLEPANLAAVGRWHEDFPETSDEELRRLMAEQSVWVADFQDWRSHGVLLR